MNERASLVAVEEIEAYEFPESSRGTPRLLAVGGGRGGVGKSLLAQNLAIYFAQLGKRVALIDGDATGTNMHAQFGVDALTQPFPLDRSVARDELAARLVPTLVPGLSLLPGAHDAIDPPPPLRAGRKSRWHARLRALPVDYVVLDVGPGHAHFALDSMLEADFSICVTAPEPPAIEAVYRFVRAAYRRRLRQTLSKDKFRLARIDRAFHEFGKLPSPLDLIRSLAKPDPGLAEIAWSEAQRLKLYLVVNQARLRGDLELAGAMSALFQRHYGVTVDELGSVEHDDTVWLSVRRRKPLLFDSPTSKAARAIERIARRVSALTSAAKDYREVSEPLPVGLPHHYATLGIGRSSNDEEVRRAFKRQREVYATGSLATSSLLGPKQLEAEQMRVEEAHDTLLDPIRRRAYDLSTFADLNPPTDTSTTPVARPALAAEQLMLQRELARELGPETEFTGSLLRKVRESQGVELDEIASRTKIARPHLVAIEEEVYSDLPAVVYVRGFVTEFAKYLRLDPTQVQRTYLRRMRETFVP